MKQALQDFFTNAGKWSCLACCYLEMAGIDDDHKFEYLRKGIENEYLDDDFYVAKPIEFLRMAGLRAKDIYKEKYELSNEKQITEYTWKGLSHFVITQSGKIVYNTLAHSNCVELGKPEWVRVIVK